MLAPASFPPQQRSTAGRAFGGPGAAVALGTIVQGALKQLSVCHPTKPGEGRELGSVPNRWNRVGSTGEHERKTWLQAWLIICTKVARDTSTSVLTIPQPQGWKIFVSLPLLPPRPFRRWCLPLIPAPATVSWLHPHPDQTPPAPRIVSQPPASPPLGTNTVHLLSTNQSQGRQTAQ